MERLNSIIVLLPPFLTLNICKSRDSRVMHIYHLDLTIINILPCLLHLFFFLAEVLKANFQTS